MEVVFRVVFNISSVGYKKRGRYGQFHHLENITGNNNGIFPYEIFLSLKELIHVKHMDSCLICNNLSTKISFYYHPPIVNPNSRKNISTQISLSHWGILITLLLWRQFYSQMWVLGLERSPQKLDVCIRVKFVHEKGILSPFPVKHRVLSSA